MADEQLIVAIMAWAGFMTVAVIAAGLLSGLATWLSTRRAARDSSHAGGP